MPTTDLYKTVVLLLEKLGNHWHDIMITDPFVQQFPGTDYPPLIELSRFCTLETRWKASIITISTGEAKACENRRPYAILRLHFPAGTALIL